MISINTSGGVAILVLLFFWLGGRSYKALKLVINVLKHIISKVSNTYDFFIRSLVDFASLGYPIYSRSFLASLSAYFYTADSLFFNNSSFPTSYM